MNLSHPLITLLHYTSKQAMLIKVCNDLALQPEHVFAPICCDRCWYSITIDPEWYVTTRVAFAVFFIDGHNNPLINAIATYATYLALELNTNSQDSFGSLYHAAAQTACWPSSTTCLTRSSQIAPFGQTGRFYGFFLPLKNSVACTRWQPSLSFQILHRPGFISVVSSQPSRYLWFSVR